MNSCASSWGMREPVGQPVGGEPVDDPVVDHLGLRARAGVRLAAEDLLRGGGVHVLAAAEDLLEHLLARDVGQQPQLDLRVVGGDQPVALLGHEAGADLAAALGADRDVLEVGVVRREAAGGGGDLAEGGAQPAVVADEVGEGVEVGALELGQLAPLLDLADDLVLVADRLEHAGVGGEAGLAAALPRQPQLLEQDLAELLRRADRELLPGERPDLALELRRPRRRSAWRSRARAARRASPPRAPSPPARRPAAARPPRTGGPAPAPRASPAGARPAPA